MKYKFIPVVNITDLQEAVPEEMMKRINVLYEKNYIVPFFGLIYDLAEDVANTMFKINMSYECRWYNEPIQNDFMEFLRKAFPTSEYIIIDDAAGVFCL